MMMKSFISIQYSWIIINMIIYVAFNIILLQVYLKHDLFQETCSMSLLSEISLNASKGEQQFDKVFLK